jgi:hypothetical protein
MEEVGCFETSALVYQTTRRYISVDCNFVVVVTYIIRIISLDT